MTKCFGSRYELHTFGGIEAVSESSLTNLKRDPLEIQHPKFENSRLGFTESDNEG